MSFYHSFETISSQEDDGMCEHLIRLSFNKIVNSKNERGGARLGKNILILHLLQLARNEQKNRLNAVVTMQMAAEAHDVMSNDFYNDDVIKSQDSFTDVTLLVDDGGSRPGHRDVGVIPSVVELVKEVEVKLAPFRRFTAQNEIRNCENHNFDTGYELPDFTVHKSVGFISQAADSDFLSTALSDQSGKNSTIVNKLDDFQNQFENSRLTKNSQHGMTGHSNLGLYDQVEFSQQNQLDPLTNENQFLHYATEIPNFQDQTFDEGDVTAFPRNLPLQNPFYPVNSTSQLVKDYSASRSASKNCDQPISDESLEQSTNCSHSTMDGDPSLADWTVVDDSCGGGIGHDDSSSEESCSDEDEFHTNFAEPQTPGTTLGARRKRRMSSPSKACGCSTAGKHCRSQQTYLPKKRACCGHHRNGNVELQGLISVFKAGLAGVGQPLLCSDGGEGVASHAVQTAATNDFEFSAAGSTDHVVFELTCVS